MDTFCKYEMHFAVLWLTETDLQKLRNKTVHFDINCTFITLIPSYSRV